MNWAALWATWALLGNAAASPQFPQNKAAGGCLSDMAVIISSSLWQADTEKMTVNQLTLHFLGRHEWEIKIAASATYNVPHINPTSQSFYTHKWTHMQTHTITVRMSHCSTAVLWPQLSLDIFSCLQSIYQSSDRKDASLTFPIMSNHL